MKCLKFLLCHQQCIRKKRIFLHQRKILFLRIAVSFQPFHAIYDMNIKALQNMFYLRSELHGMPGGKPRYFILQLPDLYRTALDNRLNVCDLTVCRAKDLFPVKKNIFF